MHLSQRVLFISLFLILKYEVCSSFDFGKFVVYLIKQRFFPFLPALSEDDLKEAALTAPDLIQQAGYPAETHTIQTDDGYLLGVHRIPYGKYNSKKEERIPVLFVPGNGCCSSMFVSGKTTNLAFILAENGYDVWLGNLRGDKYSRQHISLNPDEDEFWKYSLDEHANFDVPAMVNYVLKETRSSQIQLISHSNGGAIAMMFLAKNTQYNKKIRGTAHLAPTVHFKYTTTLYRPVMEAKDAAEFVFKKLGFYENPPWKPEILFDFCPTEKPDLCEAIFYSLTGYKPNIDRKRLPIYMTQCPSGFSNQMIFHFGQFYFRDDILAYDYGSESLNMEKYGQPKPPSYDLKEITSPQAIFYAKNDPMANPLDVAMLIKKLNASVFNYLVPDDMFTHLDFTYGDEAEKLLYIPLVDILRQMWKNQF